jgi:hypothetical protein
MGQYPSNNSYLYAVGNFCIIPNFISIISSNFDLRNFVCKNPQLTCSNNFYCLENISSIIWDLSYTTFFGGQSSRKHFRCISLSSTARCLVFCLSAPWVIGFIYKNWSVLKGPLPYFANAAEAEKIKADSET